MKPNSFPRWANLYLQFLKVPVKKPSFEYLSEICTAHLNLIPFENISKLLNYKHYQGTNKYIPDSEEFVDQLFTKNMGGTCYAINHNLCKLLKTLGFSCRYADLGKVHMAILVRLPEYPDEEVYVDCGSAAPFFKPVRFETHPDDVTAFGGDKIFIQPEEETGVYAFRRYVDGKLSKPVWTFNPGLTYHFSDFLPAIKQSYQPGQTFMKMLRCQLWQLDKKRSVSLVNHTFKIRTQTGTVKQYQLSSVSEIRKVIDEEFSLPQLPVEEAISVLNHLGINIFQREN
ncbi:arylamine N-acetyltransferase [Paenactinomyces guangxiensis]|uniref:Arylamine N-acetyltransferase n=1 Tax=Paenactinomyces guangxiensis TaxID=1490290 RepID=A0A7W1WSU6_9BACL|nr:arylamine N-acetyltransferase [Paenactinomyces guangxiensis]MBA4495426.1 arylamine N-acetyltransferase [Paenactinomyces guangxiensis]MBH8592453.1 arylamine N-acetyltransferase [Paenactinomyces guangxiensis]